VLDNDRIRPLGDCPCFLLPFVFFSASTLLAGLQEGYVACKNLQLFTPRGSLPEYIREENWRKFSWKTVITMVENFHTN